MSCIHEVKIAAQAAAWLVTQLSELSRNGHLSKKLHLAITSGTRNTIQRHTMIGYDIE